MNAPGAALWCNTWVPGDPRRGLVTERDRLLPVQLRGRH
jgi:hypothetical protein